MQVKPINFMIVVHREKKKKKLYKIPLRIIIVEGSGR